MSNYETDTSVYVHGFSTSFRPDYRFSMVVFPHQIFELSERDMEDAVDRIWPRSSDSEEVISSFKRDVNEEILRAVKAFCFQRTWILT